MFRSRFFICGRLPHRSGFTLIELLIVVAIIAILAAIAVPNMLEAQTRAKVSRAHTDLRTMATAIEAYTVDWNRPPYDGEPGFVYAGWATVLGRMTTPVAYITSVPADVFQDRGVQDSPLPDSTHFVDGKLGSRHASDYSTAYWNEIGRPGSEETTEYWHRNFAESAWKMSSPGPDLTLSDLDRGSYFGMRDFYDPTNGTNSGGDLVRSQKGPGGGAGIR